jgi:hypothetical protein
VEARHPIRRGTIIPNTHRAWAHLLAVIAIDTAAKIPRSSPLARNVSCFCASRTILRILATATTSFHAAGRIRFQAFSTLASEAVGAPTTVEELRTAERYR